MVASVEAACLIEMVRGVVQLAPVCSSSVPTGVMLTSAAAVQLRVYTLPFVICPLLNFRDGPVGRRKICRVTSHNRRLLTSKRADRGGHAVPTCRRRPRARSGSIARAADVDQGAAPVTVAAAATLIADPQFVAPGA